MSHAVFNDAALAEALDEVLATLDEGVPAEWLESKIETAVGSVEW
jgi:hypothetical protein